VKITEIYEKYRIPNNLQEHQFRVAGVVSLIADNFEQELSKQSVVSACLLHDMGNIIKFKLELFPEFLEPEGSEYWKSVKDEFIEKYGRDEHFATNEIVREVGVSERISQIVGAFGFSKASDTLETDDIEIKIAAYSDHRVKPDSLAPMLERFADGRKRYVENKNAKFDVDYFDERVAIWKKVENQIFEKCIIAPEDISNESVAPVIEKLRDFEVETN